MNEKIESQSMNSKCKITKENTTELSSSKESYNVDTCHLVLKIKTPIRKVLNNKGIVQEKLKIFDGEKIKDENDVMFINLRRYNKVKCQ